MNNCDAFQVHLHELEVVAHVGTTEGERQHLQRLVFNVTVYPRADIRSLNDDIARTVNYSAIAQAIHEAVQDSRFALIETLATEITARLVDRFPIHRVELEVRKFVLPNASYVSVRTVHTAKDDH